MADQTSTPLISASADPSSSWIRYQKEPIPEEIECILFLEDDDMEVSLLQEIDDDRVSLYNNGVATRVIENDDDDDDEDED